MTTGATKKPAEAGDRNGDDRLLAAARRLFSEKGYEATAVAEITKAAGTAVGTLYYRYGGKAEIFFAMYEEYRRRQETRVREAIRFAREQSVQDPAGLFLAGTRANLWGIWEDRDVARIIAEGETPSRFAEVSDKATATWTARNAKLLQPLGSPLMIDVLTSAVSGAIRYWSRTIVTFSDGYAAGVYIDHAIEVVARMLGTESDKPKA